VNRTLAALLRTHDGVLTRAGVVRVVPSHVLDHALASGRLVRMLPGVYVGPDRADELDVRHRASLAYAGPESALGQLSAVRVWLGCRAPPLPDDLVHVVVPAARRLRATVGVSVHRRTGFGPADVVVRADLRVTRLERALVDSWPLLGAVERRAVVLTAVGDRRTTPQRISAELCRVPNLPRRRELADLLRLLDAGCRSELEIWGYREVFTGPGFAHLEWQVPVRLGKRTVYLDVFDRAAGVAFELDGAAYHSSPIDRERDLRRDAALAAVGIVVVRYTHERLHREVAAVRREALAILNAQSRRGA
jgi:very-short-patch-repair endonuclease